MGTHSERLFQFKNISNCSPMWTALDKRPALNFSTILIGYWQYQKKPVLLLNVAKTTENLL